MKTTRFLLILTLVLASLALLLTPVYAQRPIPNPNCTNRVTVWDNDSLVKIAEAQKVSLADLAAKNGIPTNAVLFIGDVLCLDGVAAATVVTPAPTATTPAPATGGSTVTGSVQTTATPAPNIGTGGAIATTPAPTATTSGSTVTGSVQTTATPAPATGTGGATTAAITVNFLRGQTGIPAGYAIYNVQLGDSLFKISQANGVNLNTLAQANNIVNPSLIYVGETLLVPPRTTTPGGNPPAGGGTLPPAPNPGTGGPTTPTPSTGVFVPAPNTIPVLALQPTTARPGGSITVTGSNYPGNVQVTLYLEKQSAGLKSAPITTVTTQPNGTFSATITIPATWANGAAVNQYTVSVSAYTATGGYWAMNYFVNQ